MMKRANSNSHDQAAIQSIQVSEGLNLQTPLRRAPAAVLKHGIADHVQVHIGRAAGSPLREGMLDRTGALFRSTTEFAATH